jgi:hypothetical protein
MGNTPRLNYWDTLLAYAAAVLECEGFVSIAQRRRASGPNHYALTVGANMVDREVLEALSSTWGGVIGCYRRGDGYQPLHTWRLTGPKALVFLEDVSPCLTTDRARTKAAVAISFQRQKRRGQLGADAKEYHERQRGFHRAMRMLNGRGSRALTAGERAAVVAPFLDINGANGDA